MTRKTLSLGNIFSFIVFGITIITLVLLIKIVSYADDASLGRFGEAVSPVANNDITMISEKVYIKSDDEKSTVDCQFEFYNDSENEKNILMGFPSGTVSNNNVKEAYEPYGNQMLYNFKSYIDGTPANVQYEKGIKGNSTTDKLNYPYWYTWTVNFKPYEKIKVYNTYTVKNNVNSIGDIQLGYVLTTGAPWKGKIDNAEIVIEFEDDNICHINKVFPGNFKINKNKIIWKFKNFEPDKNIKVLMNVRKFGLKNDEILNKIAELQQSKKFTEIISFIDEIIKNNKADELEINSLLLKKAECYLNLKMGNEYISTLYKAAKNNTIDNYSKREAIYKLLLYFKENNIYKYREFYDMNIFLKTDMFMQELAQSIFPDLESSHIPTIYNLHISPKYININIEDMDDDIEKSIIQVWMVKDNEKIFLLNEQKEDNFYDRYTIRHTINYANKYNEYVSAADKIYYRIYVKDLNGNTIDTGEKFSTAAVYDFNHWALKYIYGISMLQEVPANASEGDKPISSKQLFEMLIKISNLDIAKREETKKVFGEFLSQDKYVKRSEAISIIVSYFNYLKILKLSDLASEEQYKNKYSDWNRVPYGDKFNIITALDYGVLEGYPDKTIRSDKIITMNEIISMLSKIKSKILNTEFKYQYDEKAKMYHSIVVNDVEARKWYFDHAGENYVKYENSKWYVTEDRKDSMYEQLCSEEFALQLINNMPEIYCEDKENKILINILQKLGPKPHRYILTVDKNNFAVLDRMIVDY